MKNKTWNNFRPILISIAMALLMSMTMLSCSSTAILTTGESLKVSGTTFVQVAAAYKQGCDVTKTIAQSQCQSFRSFGEKFQKSFPLAVQLWEAARLSSDSAMQNKVEAVIAGLTAELSAFATQMIGGK